MTITLGEIWPELQFHTIEPINGALDFLTQTWTAPEVLSYFNNRQFQFLKETGIVMKRVAIPTIPNVSRQTLPQDWIATQLVSWLGADGVTRDIKRDSVSNFDNLLSKWEINQLSQPPLAYTDSDIVDTLELQITPTNLNGVITILYLGLSTILADKGTEFSIPDEFVPAIKYGVLADMFSKAGKGQDELRSNYCELRYQEGVVAALSILESV